MLKVRIHRRRLVALGGLALLAGCKVIPKGPETGPPPPPEQPSTSTLPADQQRHRVALLVPTSGPNAGVGQAIANAATMALLDTNAANLRITTYDTATGPSAAASRAIADGNRLILGPLMGEDVFAVAAVARPAKVPIISFSNDAAVAGRDVFIMGSLPSQSIARTISFARAKGMTRFAALVPEGEYGLRATAAFNTAVVDAGGAVAGIETYSRTNTSIVSAAKRLRMKAKYDAVLIADSGRFAVQAAPLLKGPAGAPQPRLLGTELWSGDGAIATSPALRGAWYSAVSDTRWRQYADSYRTRFGAAPYRISTLGYDAVLLTLNLARSWKPGANVPTAGLYDRDGFLGLDGVFRFGTNGVVERSFEVIELRAGGVTVVSPAAVKFGN